MSTSAINTNSTRIADLARTITKKIDADGNGNLSTEEFSNFLSGILAGGDVARTNSTFAAGTASIAMDLASPRGMMEGFDATKLADGSRKGAKYEIGRILQNYPNTPQGLRDALAEIQQLVPSARITGTNGDKLDFGGWVDGKQNVIGVVDVLRAASLGGAAWQWQPAE